MARSAHNPRQVREVLDAVDAAAAVEPLDQDISASYTEAEVQAISDKVDELIAALTP